MIKSPLLYGSVAAIGLLLTLYLLEILAHSDTKREFAAAEQRHAVEYQAYALASAARAQAVSEAQEQAQADRDRHTENIKTLLQAINGAERAVILERNKAAARIAAIEAENGKIMEWADTGIPDDYLAWMREPNTPLPAP
ncbi:MAG TPA: hypothetical protein PKH39_17800 [Woeseiaceae bacterium]|nr:hypothetical protein [Woeseiaceae bacterium]